MLPLEVVFAALFGLALGSFLNVCIVRMPRGESVVHPPSHCPLCDRPIGPLDNLPMISWLLLRGRSRCCGRPISLRYPVVEAAAALLFVGCLLAFGLTVTGVGMAVLGWLLLGLAWMDAETLLLPDTFTLTGLALGVGFQGVLGGRTGWLKAVGHSLASAAIFGGLLLAIALLYKLVRRREGMGMGDVKLAAMLGAWLGWQLSGVVLFLAVVAGAIVGTIIVFAKKSRDAGALRLPFGTFLAGSGMVTLFAGPGLLAWYLGLF
jgi:leader peptidase (prepilin peptidase)/N-methyltransferase